VVIQCHGHFEHPGRAGGAFEMPEIGLNRTERDTARLEVELSKNGVETAHFSQVANRRGGPVAFDQANAGGRDGGILPGALDGALLAKRVGAVMPLPLPSLLPPMARITA